MHHACKRGGSERNPHDRKDASKLQRARTTHNRSTRMHPQIAKRARDNRRPPMRRPELPLSPAPVHPSARRFQARNRRQPAPLAGRESRCAPPRGRLAGRDAVRTPARREAGPARNEPGGAAQRRGASGVALCAWGCARFARKPPTGLTNSKTGCAPCHAPRTSHAPEGAQLGHVDRARSSALGCPRGAPLRNQGGQWVRQASAPSLGGVRGPERAHLALLTPTPSRSARRPRRRAHTCEARGGTRAE